MGLIVRNQYICINRGHINQFCRKFLDSPDRDVRIRIPLHSFERSIV